MPIDEWQEVKAAFSKQSAHFDEDDFSNPVLQTWRKRIYGHVDQFIRANSKMLELNAGTGIDAIHFAKLGHSVHATDISEGMIAKIQAKTQEHSLSNKITIQQISFDQLDQVDGKFDYVFSNFGGLNCIGNLNRVTKHLPHLLNDNAIVTWVIMPRIAPWEWTWMWRGKFGQAFRRFNKNGADAHLKDEHFKTYYFSLREIKTAFGSEFQLIKAEGLGVFSPPPASLNFVRVFPRLSNLLASVDRGLSRRSPFNKWGDHIVVTFKFNFQNR
jgi:SAM-dependent methyltransferase